MTAATTRRATTRRAAALGALAATAVAGTTGTAEAYAPRKHHGKNALLPKPDRHLVSRFSYGITPKLAKDVRKAGGAQGWFERQLNPRHIKDKQTDKIGRWWPEPAPQAGRALVPPDRGHRGRLGGDGRLLALGADAPDDVQAPAARGDGRVLGEPPARAAVGDAQFTCSAWTTATPSASTRSAASTRCCSRATTHPAMLIYLDAGESTKEHPNENLGRELLELHTVGAGNYSEKDVRDSARILTGYSVDYWETWRAIYNQDDHYTGRVKVKGFRDKNNKANGKATTAAYLRYLAHHPDTAQQIAYKLCVKFVDDKPSKALVRQLARVYLENDTAIVPVLRALVASPAFRHAARQEGPRPGRGRRGDLPRARREDQGSRPAARRPTARRCRRWSGRATRSASSRSRGARRTASRSTTSRGPRRPGCSARCGSTWASPAAGPTRPRLPQAGEVAAGQASRASTSSSTTCASELLHQRVDASAAQGLLRRRRRQADEPIDKDHALVAVGVPAPAGDRPRLPRPPEPVTP